MPKFNIQKINIYFSVLTAVATIAAMFFLSLFLYKNFYQTITQSEEILLLKQKVAPLSINMDKFNEVMENIEKKGETRSLDGINNPFAANEKTMARKTKNEEKKEAAGEKKEKSSEPTDRELIVPEFK